MRHVSGKGFVITTEAFLSLIVALLLISMINMTYRKSSPRESLIRYQHANDLAEALWESGDYAKIGDWIEGGDSQEFSGRVQEIAEDMSWCIILDVEDKGKRLEFNCNEKGKDTISITRTIVGKKGFYELRFSLS